MDNIITGRYITLRQGILVEKARRDRVFCTRVIRIRRRHGLRRKFRKCGSRGAISRRKTFSSRINIFRKISYLKLFIEQAKNAISPSPQFEYDKQDHNSRLPSRPAPFREKTHVSFESGARKRFSTYQFLSINGPIVNSRYDF